jgi:putative ABC transport system permease protein
MEGHAHNEHRYVVTGILKKSNTVLDNIILTNVESVWEMHHDSTTAKDNHLQDKPDGTFTPSRLVPSVASGDSVKEITSMLIQYRSALGAIQLPRFVNSQSKLQAASPAFETARLFSILGIGVDILMGFAYVLIAISGLSIFIALYNSLKERRYDMAIMRSMGATRPKLFISILLEGGILTGLGSVTGLLLGHGVLLLLGTIVDETRKAGITGIAFYSQEWIILGGSLLLGLLCAVIPAVQAYRSDISKVLAQN